MHPNSLKNLKPAKKGEVRNPKGRPTKRVSLTDNLKDELLKIPREVTVNGVKVRNDYTNAELIAKAWVRKMVRGDGTLIREALERLEGRVKMRTELTGPDGGPIQTSSEKKITLDFSGKTVKELIVLRNALEEVKHATSLPEN
jgi:hypothetical protein